MAIDDEHAMRTPNRPHHSGKWDVGIATSATITESSESARVPPPDRVVLHIRVEVNATLEPDRVLRDESPSLAIVATSSVVVEPARPVPFPAGEGVRVVRGLDVAPGVVAASRGHCAGGLRLSDHAAAGIPAIVGHGQRTRTGGSHRGYLFAFRGLINARA